MSDYEFRTLAVDDLDEVLKVREQSFGALAEQNRAEWLPVAAEQVEAGRFVGAYDVAADPGRPIAAARIWDFRQWWAGRQVPMAGIGGVVVRPDYRGRGVGRYLMEGVVDRARELGSTISALYPATLPLYRRVGYEFAGVRSRYAFRAAALRDLGDTPASPESPACGR